MKAKKTLLKTFLLIGLVFSTFDLQAQWGDEYETDIIVGAERTHLYIPHLLGKNVAIVMNHTSLFGDQLLVDTLLKQRIKVKKIFTPEHGLRGNADAGQQITNTVDEVTGLPIISLYGTSKKPAPEHLADIDIVLFDLQDVGVRFFTYISTLHYVMEACAENKKKLIVLDRPNPNGDYVDGPVLKLSHKSFVGMHPIPVVHGLTIGELANMINEEGWLGNDIYNKLRCELEVIKCENYTHSKKYDLPVNPSPNLPNYTAVRLYPSLCLFEGTAISVGRGTGFPFQVYGHPSLTSAPFNFTPKSVPGKALTPIYMGETCRGYDLREKDDTRFTLKYLVDAYSEFPDKSHFFNSFFRKLIGNDDVQKWIEDGKSAELISKSWLLELKEYKTLRKKYLLYEDFEE